MAVILRPKTDGSTDRHFDRHRSKLLCACHLLQPWDRLHRVPDGAISACCVRLVRKRRRRRSPRDHAFPRGWRPRRGYAFSSRSSRDRKDAG